MSRRCRRAHARYAEERDALIPADWPGPAAARGGGRHPQRREVPARPCGLVAGRRRRSGGPMGERAGRGPRLRHRGVMTDRGGGHRLWHQLDPAPGGRRGRSRADPAHADHQVGAGRGPREHAGARGHRPDGGRAAASFAGPWTSFGSTGSAWWPRRRSGTRRTAPIFIEAAAAAVGHRPRGPDRARGGQAGLPGGQRRPRSRSRATPSWWTSEAVRRRSRWGGADPCHRCRSNSDACA